MSTLATVSISTAAAVIGAAAMYLPAHLRLLDARAYRAAADDTFTQAERLAAEVDRTRNLPWYWPTGPAIEAAPAEHEAEVLHVAYPTQELRLVDGLARLADEVGLVQALSDRPAEDEDEVGDEQPGEALADAPAGLRARFGAWWREQRFRIRVLCQVRREVPVNPPYRGRHWISDVQHTGQFQVINVKVPAQRTGDEA